MATQNQLLAVQLEISVSAVQIRGAAPVSETGPSTQASLGLNSGSDSSAISCKGMASRLV